MMAGQNLKASPVDRGWAWVILAGAVVSYSLAIGSLKCFGLLFTEFLETFGKSTSTTAFIPSIHMASVHFTGLLANYLTTRCGFKRVVITGGVLCAVGYFTTAFVPRMEYMYITSAIAGVGVGSVTSPTVTLTNHYFLAHRAKAIGIVTPSASTIMFGLPHLYRFLIETYSIRGALIIISGILLHICVSASLYRQPVQKSQVSQSLEHTSSSAPEAENIHMHKILREDISHEERETLISTEEIHQDSMTKTLDNSEIPVREMREEMSYEEGETRVSTEEICKGSMTKMLDSVHEIKEDTKLSNSSASYQTQTQKEKSSTPLMEFQFSLIKNPTFLFIAFSYLMGMSGYSIMLIMLPAYAKQILHTSSSSAAVLSSLGIAETASKLFIGCFIDRKIVSCRTIWTCCLAAAAVSAICTIFCRSVVSLCAVSALFGATGGSIFILLSQTLVEILGINLLVSGLGLSKVFSGIGNLFSPPLSGLIKDETGSWNGACILAGCFCALSAFVMQIGKIRERCTQAESLKI